MCRRRFFSAACAGRSRRAGARARAGAGFAHWRHQLAGAGPVPVLLRPRHVRASDLLAARAFAAVDAPVDEFGRKKILNGSWVGPVLFAERELARAAIKGGHDGWAAFAYTATKEPFTCWDSGLRRVRSECLESDGDNGSRMFPRQASISAALSGAGQAMFAGKQCAWFVHTGGDTDWRRVTEADCAGAATLTVPVNSQFSLLSQVLDPASAGGVMTQVTAVYQEVKSRVVVGLGDSYASGEGNPDYPANFSKGSTLADSLRPQPSSGPAWLDPACHRSVYSHQQRIAMQLAAENPHAVVSFLGYACSGRRHSRHHGCHRYGQRPCRADHLVGPARLRACARALRWCRRRRRGRSLTMPCVTCAPTKAQPRQGSR